MTASNVFIDTCCFIYALEHQDEIGSSTRTLISNYKENGYSLWTSSITLMEYTSKNHEQAKMVIKQFVKDNQITVIPITTIIAYTAGKLRENSKLHAMDSLQLASAQSIDSKVIFLTNDIRLKQFANDSIHIVIIEET